MSFNPSTPKTPNCQLPQWVSGDKPAMEDFNQVIQNIDTELGSLNDSLADKANATALAVIETGTVIPASGFTHGSSTRLYRNVITGVKTFCGSITKTSGNITGSETLATLPEGFWPSANILIMGVTYKSDTYTPVMININTAGVVTSSGAGSMVWGTLVFFSGSFM